ncbi:MAG: hypothetical protein ABR538_09585 [Candidatus Binatia bacterium]
MKRRFILVALCAFALGGCTAMRVSGTISDAVTGEPVGGCGVTVATRVVVSDFRGQYSAKVRRGHRPMSVVCPGYELQQLEVDSSKTRRPTVNVQMTPVKRARPRGTARMAPGTR